MTAYDVLIIGGGPAGLAAATTLVRQLHSVVIFDSGIYRNSVSKHMHNVATWDHKDPAEYRSIARRDLLARYKNVQFQDTEVSTLKEVNGSFEATDSDNKVWSGRKVILATGVRDELPDIEGYAECWAKGIFHCLFCHGYEERNRGGGAGVLAVGQVAHPAHALQVARNSMQLCGSTTIFTNGSKEVAEGIKAAIDEKHATSSAIAFDDRLIRRLSLSINDTVKIEFADGSATEVAFLAHVPQTRPSGPFVEQLGLETSPPSNDIKTSPPFLQTSRRGVFACGDNMLMAKAVPNAIANGSNAAVGASVQLQCEVYGHKCMFYLSVMDCGDVDKRGVLKF